MLSSGLANAFVCTRCALRISLRDCRVRRPLSNKYSQIQRRRASGATFADEDRNSPPIKGVETEPVEEEEIHILYRIDPRIPRHKRAKLGVPSLGKPAEIIIVDEDYQPRRRPPEPQNEVDPRSGSLDDAIREAVHGLDKASTQEEVDANIEGLRRSLGGHDGFITAQQREELAQSLGDGFSQTQLYGYLKPRYVDTQLARKPTETRSKKTALVREKKIRRLNNAGKLTLVNIIINTLWGLQVRGEHKTVEIPVDRRKIELLMVNPTLELKSICSRADVRLQFNLDAGQVEVYGVADNIDRFVSALSNFIANIQVREFTLRKLGYDGRQRKIELGESLPRSIGRRYGIHLSTRAGQAWALVYYASDERLLDQAIRDIYLAARSTGRMENARLWGSDGFKDLRLATIPCDDSMPERDRRFKWRRWAGAALEQPVIPDPKTVSKDIFSPKDRSSLKWWGDVLVKHAAIRLEVSAVFGQTLINDAPEQIPTAQTPLKRSAISKSYIPIAFARDYPRLPQTLDSLSRQTRPREIDLLMWPKPLRDKDDEQYPEIHVSLSPAVKDGDGRPQVNKMTAVLARRPFDLLLPHSAVDVRFELRLCYDLLHADDEAIKALVSTIRKQLTSVTESPGLVDVPPPPILADLISGWNIPYTTTEVTDSGSIIEVEVTDRTVSYLIAPPKIIDSVQFDYGGFPLIYSQTADQADHRHWKTLTMESGSLLDREKGPTSAWMTEAKEAAWKFSEKAILFATRMGKE